MLNKITWIAIITLMIGATTARAADVYLDQAGSSSTIDITQQGDGNSVGTQAERTTINGSSADIDISQDGSSNTVDIETGSSTTAPDIDVVQSGDSNELNIDLGSVSDPAIDVNIAGSSNQVDVCGTVTTAASSVTDAVCGTDMSQDYIGVDIDIANTSDSNKIAIGRSGITGTDGTTEVKVSIGGTTAGSDSNIVNITQDSTTESGVVDLTIDGTGNEINITQGDGL